jgi:hypothetical protein
MKDDTKKLKVHTINNLNKPYYIIKINIYIYGQTNNPYNLSF